MKPLSCIFYYQMRARVINPATKKTEVLMGPDGKPVLNDNYISFLQVISAFWENVEQIGGGYKLMLNIFLNGGSVTTDRDGNRILKPGYTVVFPEFQGQKFITQWWNWGERFGLSPSVLPPYSNAARSEGSEREHFRRTGRNQARAVIDEDFIDPDQPQDAEAAVTIE